MVLKCSSFQHVLDRAIGLVFYTSLGYKVVGVRPNGVILRRGGETFEVLAVPPPGSEVGPRAA